MLANTSLATSLCALLHIIAVSATKSKGCGKTLASTFKKGGVGDSNRVTFTTSSGTERKLLLHIPTTYDSNTATPLIFSFHGRGESGAGQESKSRLSDETFNPNMFVVYPDGIDSQWQGDPAATGYNDTGFVLDMIGSFEDEFCINTRRIYSSGHSNGAGFSLNQLACDPVASTKIAAFMGSSAATYQDTTDDDCIGATVPITCNPGRQMIPILETHGSADDVIAYTGGPRRDRCLPSAPHFVTEWARRNGLGTTNVTTPLLNSTVKRYRFGSQQDVPGLVTHYRIEGMGHTWPWADQDGRFDATPVVIDFFNNYTLPSSPESSTSTTRPTTSTTKFATSTTIPTITSTTKSATSTSKAAVATRANTPKDSASSSANNPPSCPASDHTVYTTADGVRYTIHCGYDSSSRPIAGATYPGSFAKCIAQCDATSGCKSVSYVGACYLKGLPGRLVGKASVVYRVAVKVD